MISGTNVNTNWTNLKTAMATGGYIRLDANCTDGTKNSDSYLNVPQNITVVLNLNGKTINRNLTTAINDGYVIYNRGTLTINGSGTITGGKNTGAGGGIYDYGTLTINGGSITGNTASKGGGIFEYLHNTNTTINGVSITENSATEEGGGIYVSIPSSKTITICGGSTISNNSADENGGGIYYSEGILKIKGKVTISGNTKGSNPNNVYFFSGHKITVDDILDSETSIGVSAKVITTLPRIITSGLSEKGVYSYFTSDNATYAVRPDDNNAEACLKRIISPTVSMSGWTYGSSASSPSVSGNTGKGTVTYTYKAEGGNEFTSTKPTNAGTHTVKATIAETSSYTAGEATNTYTVDKRAVVVSGITASNKTYDGNTTATIVTTGASFQGRVGEDALTVSTSGTFADANVAENKTVTLGALTLGGTSVGNYKLATSGQQTTTTATITKKALSITAKPKSITYGDAPANNSVSYSGFVNNETENTDGVLGGTLAYGYDYTQYGDVGSYNITPSGLTSNNYEITFNAGTLTVGQKEVGLNWSTDSPFTYDGQSHCLTATATETVNGDEIGVTVTGEQTNAGDSYTATASALTGEKSGNYKLPDAKTQGFTINRRAVTVTPNDGQSKTYGDSNPTLTYTATGLVGTETLTGALARAEGESVSAGPYAITQGTVTDANNGNYTITFTTGKTFAISSKTIGISWGPTLLTYNGSAQAPTATATGLVGTDACTLTVTGQQTAVGVYTLTNAPATVTALDNTNYQLPTTGLTTGFEIANPLSISFAANQTWATWYGGYNYEVPAGMTAYKVSSVSGSTVTVDAITYVPANTGVLIKRTATEAAVANSNVYNGETSVITSLLRNGNPTPYIDYILYNDGFVLSSVSTLGDHRCYLPGTGTAGTRGLTIDFGNGTTDISPKTAEVFDSGEWFDLQGRRIEKPQKKGLYILNGKKVIIK